MGKTWKITSWKTYVDCTSTSLISIKCKFALNERSLRTHQGGWNYRLTIWCLWEYGTTGTVIYCWNQIPTYMPNAIVESLERTLSMLRYRNQGKVLYSKAETEQHPRRIHPLRQRQSPKEESLAMAKIEDLRKGNHPYISEMKCPGKHLQLKVRKGPQDRTPSCAEINLPRNSSNHLRSQREPWERAQTANAEKEAKMKFHLTHRWGSSQGSVLPKS